MPLRPVLFFLFLFFTTGLAAQALLTATDTTGGAYATIRAAGFGIEGPDDSSSDCQGGGPGNHTSFGDHVTQAYDTELARGVFVFHSHIDEDNDRCRVFDRARMELKGGPAGNTDDELEHKFGDISHYRWQFRLDENFVGASSFNHLFQNKAQGGSDSGFPILTITARTNVLQLLHNAGSENTAGTRGQLASASLEQFRGKWVEVYMRQVYTNTGALTVTITDVTTGLLLLSYAGTDLDLWRGPDNATSIINRPKFGIYRAYNEDAGLRDEEVRFAQFCASETDAELCPSIIDLNAGVPGPVAGLLPLNGSQNVPDFMPLTWRPVAGATEYRIYLGSEPDDLQLDTVVIGNTYRPELAPGTTYYFQVVSTNNIGESRGEVFGFTTLATPDDSPWRVARGHAAPHVEASQFFALSTNLEEVGLDSTARIPSGQGNNTYCWFSGPKEDGAGNYRWRYRQEAGEEVTLILRLRALSDNNNLTYIEFYGLGWRQKLRINRNTLKFEKAPGDPAVDFPDGFWDDSAYHVLRVTFAKGATVGAPVMTTVYLDEHAFPFGGPLPSDEEHAGHYLDVGRAGGIDYGACFDYLAVNPTGVFPPSEDAEALPPADLELPAVVVNVSEWAPLKTAVYPNPTDGQLYLSGLPTDQRITYRILNYTGQEIRTGWLDQSHISLPTTHLIPGPYLLQLRYPDGTRAVIRFIRGY